ncbi:MAG: virulence factor SrfB [Pseudomonadota bacterium]
MAYASDQSLHPLHTWKSDATLVPYSGVQFVDFGFDINAIGSVTRQFIERTVVTGGERDECTLIPLTGDEEADADLVGQPREDDDEYSINKTKALEPFLNKWAPAPVFRIKPGRARDGSELYDAGPSAWARVYVTELESPEPDTGYTHRAILSFDTQLATKVTQDAYTTPTGADAADERVFRFVTDPSKMGWFLSSRVDGPDGTQIDRQKWVSEWLEEMFLEFKRAQKGKPVSVEDLEHRLEHWSRYIAMIQLLNQAVRIPAFKLLDTVSDERRYEPIDVDLVIDVGNSRTCGILVESFPGETRINLNDSYVLGLRDLGRPELYYKKPLESRVEFAEASFGRDHIARRSRPGQSFLWPSFVRIGPEAMRLAKATEGTETTSGLSSPKRYLWDDQPTLQDWRFQNTLAGASLPPVARSAFRFLNERGDVVAQVKDDIRRKLLDKNAASQETALRPRFSRSALYGFMLAELISHALVMINAPAVRAGRQQSDVPRRLRQVILSLPSATPLQEQAIMRSRAEGALKLVWQIMGLKDDTTRTTQRPNVIVDWDEATATQLVWLYSEIVQKFGGQIESFMRLKGQDRSLPEAPGGPVEPSLRLACIDIGGGTTDLMISTYYCESNRAIRPRQAFREGFRIAGDDLVREVVSRIVLEQLKQSLEAAGATFAGERLRELFGGDLAEIDEQTRQCRRQFGLRILAPLGVAALQASEKMGPGDTKTIHAGDVVGWKPKPTSDRVVGMGRPAARPAAQPQANGADELERELAEPQALLDYLEVPARKAGAADWRMADFALTVSRANIDAAIRVVLEKVLQDMCEVIDHLECDVVLLAGRPSRLPAVRDIVREQLAVPPHRLISMHELRVDGWYPYRDPVTNRISDPKTTAAVGAMLCSLSEAQIGNFKLFTSDLQMTSTARFIGEMELNGQIKDERIIFDAEATAPGAETQEFEMFTRMQIGFRQLPLERWTATPLYRLEFTNAQAQKHPAPLRIKLGRRDVDDDSETAEGRLRAEALKEALEPAEIVDANGEGVPARDVRLRFHTLGFEDDYWLDSGIFKIA